MSIEYFKIVIFQSYNQNTDFNALKSVKICYIICSKNFENMPQIWKKKNIKLCSMEKESQFNNL